jgi:hypothetical protein
MRALEVRELVWEAPIQSREPTPATVLVLVTEGHLGATRPGTAEAKKEAAEEAQEAKEEAAEDARERAEESS